jgi:tetratricopeptide (TPR) repeat protein
MVDQLINRAKILLQQGRYREAESLLKDALATSPNDLHVMFLLIESFIQQNKTDSADALVNTAIFHSPNSAFLYYMKSRVEVLRDKYDEAEKHLRNAIKLDPSQPDFFAFWSQIKIIRKDFEKALEFANTALGLDSENLMALNCRSTALVKLDRKAEAFQTIEGALREDPNSAYTHANYGWGLLEKGDHKKALSHFSEALKSDPTNEYAQSGMVEALKARYFIYRLFLKYSFWIGNMKSNYQWGFLIGFYILYRALIRLSSSNGALRPYLTPIIVLMAVIAFSSWVIVPLSNLFLRLNRFGVHLLNEKERLSSSFVGLSCAVFITGSILYLTTQIEACLGLAYFGFAMMIPLGSMFAPSRSKYFLPVYAIAMCVIGIGAVLLAFADRNLFNGLTILFLLCFIAYQWITNYIIIKETNR